MSLVPEHLFYTKEHEWVEVIDSTTVRFGITDYAQNSLGDIVYVALPALGSSVKAGESCGEVESTKSVSEIYAPVTGEVIGVNENVEANPELLNVDSYTSGWLVTVLLAGDLSQYSLLSPAEYQGLTQ